jgi:hypothetical protein
MIQFISYVSATKQVKQCSLKDQMDTIGPKCGQSWLMHFNWRINSHFVTWTPQNLWTTCVRHILHDALVLNMHIIEKVQKPDSN